MLVESWSRDFLHSKSFLFRLQELLTYRVRMASGWSRVRLLENPRMPRYKLRQWSDKLAAILHRVWKILIVTTLGRKFQSCFFSRARVFIGHVYRIAGKSCFTCHSINPKYIYSVYVYIRMYWVWIRITLELRASFRGALLLFRL